MWNKSLLVVGSIWLAACHTADYPAPKGEGTGSEGTDIDYTDMPGSSDPSDGRDPDPPDTGDPKHPRPNIVIVVSDDQTPYMLGAAGNTVIRTPELDQLAREGIYLTRMYLATGTCSGSRASLISGRLPHANGVLKNGQGIDLEQPLLPRMLQRSGYHTGMIGKCHLEEDPYYEDPDNDGDKTPVNPDPFTAELGYDFRLLFYPDKGYLTDFYDYEMVRNGEPEKVRDEYSTDKLTDEAIAYMHRQSDRKEPFFLWLAYNTPHEPLWNKNRPPEFNPDRGGKAGYSADEIPRPPSLDDDLSTKPPQQLATRTHERYDESDLDTIRRHQRNAYEMVENMDTNVGRIMDELDALHLTQDTIFVFLSDNGQFFGEHEMMAKGATFYEEQMRSPVILHYPRLDASGRKDALASSIDIMPTMLEFANIPVPDSVMGRSLVPLLRGHIRSVRESAYMEYAGWRQYNFPMRGLVRGDFKFVHYMTHGDYDDYGFELYDLQTDPFEMDNLLQRPEDGSNPLALALDDPVHGEVLQRIRLDMARWQTITRDPARLQVDPPRVSITGNALEVSASTDIPTSLVVATRARQCPECGFTLYDENRELELSHTVVVDTIDLRSALDIQVYLLGDNGHGAMWEYIIQHP